MFCQLVKKYYFCSMKRQLLLLLFSLFYLSSIAADKWDGVSLSAPLYSDGFRVGKAAELAWVAQESLTRSFADTLFYLTDDIDLASFPFTPIGSGSLPFAGTLDGQAHTISNLYINSAVSNGVGLFGVLAEGGELKNIALAQGVIFLNEISDVGALVGINYGQISSCFAMTEIIAHDGVRVGGIAGRNMSTGKIEYCYNTGIVSDARGAAGGLVGQNEGVISCAYNIGFTANGGAAVGQNMSSGVLTEVYCDQKMCRKEAGTGDVSGVGVKEKTKEMYHLYPKDTKWVECDSLYPQLAVFADKAVSLVSVAPAIVSEARTERAELLTTNLSLSTDNGVRWSSPQPDVIRVRGGWGQVTRPCQTQQVMLEARKDNFTKKVYTALRGYDVFTAGTLASEYTTCLNHPVTFASHGLSSRTAGGKDDDLDNYPYTYKIEKYGLRETVSNGVATTDTFLMQSTVMVGDESFRDYVCSADSFGVFLYRLYAHDAYCQTEFLRAGGLFRYVVHDEVEAGAIDALPDTIYGTLPATPLITQTREPHGGDGSYHFQWYVTELKVDYVTGRVDTLEKDKELKIGRQSVDTFQYAPAITHAGEYLFERMARDSYCMYSDEYLLSDGTKRFVVYDSLYAGALHSEHIISCEPMIDDTLHADSVARGGNGRYEYRWLMNGKVIDGMNKPELQLRQLTLDYDHTYIFQRQVKDDTGFMDWTTSDGVDTVSIRQAFFTGSIRSSEATYCVDADCLCGIPSIEVLNERLPSGEGPFSYAYLLSYVRGNDTLALDTVKTNESSALIGFSPKPYNVPLPSTFVLRRLVSDTLCHRQGQRSGGEIVMHVGVEESKQIIAQLCSHELPYKNEYTYIDGRKEAFELREAGQTRVFYDRTALGCSRQVSYVLEVKPAIEVRVDSLGMLCQSQSGFDIDYTIIKGAPTHCEVTFDDKAHQAGMRDTLVMLTETGVINLTNPEFATGTFGITLRFLNLDDASACPSESSPMSFTFALDGYVRRKWTDVLYADNNDKNGYPDPLHDHRFVSWTWYKDGQEIEGANEQFYQEQGGLNGVYYVVMRDDEGNSYRSCDFEARPLTGEENISSTMLSVRSTQPHEVLVVTQESGWLEVYGVDGRCWWSGRATGRTMVSVPSKTAMCFVLRTDTGKVYSLKSLIR